MNSTPLRTRRAVFSQGTATLVANDCVVPAQYNAVPDVVPEGERNLRLAVIEAALVDYQKYPRSKTAEGQDLWEEAREWIFSGDADWEYSFENCCDAVHLDAGYIRRLLAPWSRTGCSRPRFKRKRARIHVLTRSLELKPSEGGFRPTPEAVMAAVVRLNQEAIQSECDKVRLEDEVGINLRPRWAWTKRGVGRPPKNRHVLVRDLVAR